MSATSRKNSVTGLFGTLTAQAGAIQLPEQKASFKISTRFGHVPVAEDPLGYDRERRFEQHYPRIELPFQLVDTVETGDKKRYERRMLRQFWGNSGSFFKNEIRFDFSSPFLYE